LVAAPPIDAGLIRDTAERLLVILSDATYRRTFKLAVYATGDRAGAEVLADDVKLTEEEQNTLAELSVSLAEKYRVAVQYMPEIAAGLCFGGWLWRTHKINSRLAELVEAKRKASTATAPPPGEK
jgi:hypothetical protein